MTIKVVPHSIDYDVVKKVDYISTMMLYFSAAISIAIIIFDSFGVPLLNISNSILSVIGILYFSLDVLQNYLFQIAEFNRKNDFIDNSLDTTLADKNSQGYFSNENISYGINKLGVNCFENSFFTKTISTKMIPKMIVKSSIILVLYLAVALFTNHEVLAALLQVTLPFTIIQQTIKLVVFNNKIKIIFNQFKQIFTTTTTDKRDSLIFDNVLNYEKVLAWGCIQLDSKLFNKYNTRLTGEWEEIKQKHKIQP